MTGRALLVRDRLLDRLRSRWVAQVTVVRAPAGYGKTTLLTQARADNAAAPLGVEAWLQCGPGMAVVSSFGAALCDAVGARRPGRGDPGDLATAVVEALWRRSPRQVTLLVDDVHEIPPGSDAAALLAAIVAALPDNGHVVLSGRGSSPVPLGRLEVEGRVVVLDEEELAFTPAELVEFAELRRVAGTRVAGCGGWPALAAEALPVLQDRITESGYRNSTVLIAAHSSVVHAWRSEPDRAARHLEQARATAEGIPRTPLLDTNLAVAEAMLALASGDETAAAGVLAAYVERHPIGRGIAAGPQRRHLALVYVLVPASRPAWDAGDLGPAWVAGRELARAVAAVREQGALPADAPALDDAGLVLAHLPPGWAAEVAVAAIAAGREDGWTLLDATWPATRDAVAALASGGRGNLRRAAREVVGQLPVPPTARWELRLLGPVELRVDDRPARSPDWRRGRVRSLLAYLALHGSAGRGQVGDDLWPSFDVEAQSANLRVTLTYLLRVLEPDRAPRDASFFVRQHGGNLALHPGRWLAVDVWDFDRLCDEAAEADGRGAPATALDRALQAVELWRGEPTELLSDHWSVAPFEQRRRRFTAVATRAGELLLAQGAVDHAHSLAEQALALDPWLDTAHRLVVASHRATGNDLAARRALRRYREAIRELGLGPDEATLMMERLLDALPKVHGR